MLPVADGQANMIQNWIAAADYRGIVKIYKCHN